MKTTLIIAVTLTLILSCKRKSSEFTKLEWQVEHAFTGEPLEGIEVRLHEYSLGRSGYFNNGFGPDDGSIIWTGKTDKDGRIRHAFNASQNDHVSYYMSVKKMDDEGREFENFSTPVESSITKGEENFLNMSLAKHGQYVYKIENQNCFNFNDQMRWRENRINFNYESDFGMWSDHYFGCHSEVTGNRFSGPQMLIIEMEIDRNNQNLETVIDTFYVAGFNETDTIRLVY